MERRKNSHNVLGYYNKWVLFYQITHFLHNLEPHQHVLLTNVCIVFWWGPIVQIMWRYICSCFARYRSSYIFESFFAASLYSARARIRHTTPFFKETHGWPWLEVMHEDADMIMRIDDRRQHARINNKKHGWCIINNDEITKNSICA